MTIKYIPVEGNDMLEYSYETYCTDEKILTYMKFKDNEVNNRINVYEKSTRISTSVYPSAMVGGTQRVYEQTAIVPFVGYDNIGQKMFSALVNRISTEEVNGEKCYVMAWWRRWCWKKLF